MFSQPLSLNSLDVQVFLVPPVGWSPDSFVQSHRCVSGERGNRGQHVSCQVSLSVVVHRRPGCAAAAGGKFDLILFLYNGFICCKHRDQTRFDQCFVVLNRFISGSAVIAGKDVHRKQVGMKAV